MYFVGNIAINNKNGSYVQGDPQTFLVNLIFWHYILKNVLKPKSTLVLVSFRSLVDEINYNKYYKENKKKKNSLKNWFDTEHFTIT